MSLYADVHEYARGHGHARDHEYGCNHGHARDHEYGCDHGHGHVNVHVREYDSGNEF